MMKNKVVWIIIILVLVIAAIFIFSFDGDNSGNQNSDNQKEIVVDKDCQKLAEQFADNNSSTEDGLVSTWSVVRSLLKEENRICYAEFDRNVRILSDESDFSEYHLYDLINEKEINSLTYYESENYGSVEGEWEKYYEQKSPKYFKDREEIFGVGE